MRFLVRTFFSLMLVCCLSLPGLAADYHVYVNGQQQGPYAISKLKELKAQGALSKGTMVWTEGMSDWGPAGKQDGLQELFVKSSPPPVPAGDKTPPPAPSMENSQQASSSSGDNVSQQAVDRQNQMSKPQPINNAADSIYDWGEEVLSEFGLDSWGEHNGIFVFMSSESTSLKPTDPQYGDSLINAFDKAMMKVQKKYLMHRFGEQSVDKLRKVFSDRSTNAKNIPLPKPDDPNILNKVANVMEKGLDVTSKKLDKKLIELGVDPAEFKQMTPKKKKDLFKNTFIKNTIRQASGSIAGLFPIQTKIARDTNGTTKVGVIAVASLKSIQVAKDIGLKRKSIVTGEGKKVSSLLPDSKSEYMATFGTRFIYDQKGKPSILSYGIASYNPDTGNSYINENLRSQARQTAVSNADAQIAEVVNGYMNAKNEQKTGEVINQYVEREMKAGSPTTEKIITDIVKKYQEQAKSSASVDLQGISTVKRWRYTAKTGQKFVGAVRVWKYDTLQAVKDFNTSSYAEKKKKNTDKQESLKKEEKKGFSSFEESSDSVNDLNDF